MNNFFNVILQNEGNLNLYSNHKMSNNNNALNSFVYCSINMIRKEQIERQKILEKSFQSKNCQSLFDGIHFRPYCSVDVHKTGNKRIAAILNSINTTFYI